ncbi:MAG: hypothetical protein AAFZ89_00870 [Bacteroidota bacterium]
MKNYGTLVLFALMFFVSCSSDSGGLDVPDPDPMAEPNVNPSNVSVRLVDQTCDAARLEWDEATDGNAGDTVGYSVFINNTLFFTNYNATNISINLENYAFPIDIEVQATDNNGGVSDKSNTLVIEDIDRNIVFEDINLKSTLLDARVPIDTNEDGEISICEASAHIDGLELASKNITSLVGLEFFVNVSRIDAAFNAISDVSPIADLSLDELALNENDLTTFDIGASESLKSLYLNFNEVSSLDLSVFPNLENVQLLGNGISTLDVSQNTKLVTLQLGVNNISQIDVSKNTELEVLSISENNFTSIDVSKNTKLKVLKVFGNSLTTLNMETNSLLETVHCSRNDIVELDLSGNTLLKSFRGFNNPLLAELNLKNGNNGILEEMLAHFNPNLSCIQIDDLSNIPLEGWNKDDTSSYSNDCNN